MSAIFEDAQRNAEKRINAHWKKMMEDNAAPNIDDGSLPPHVPAPVALSDDAYESTSGQPSRPLFLPPQRKNIFGSDLDWASIRSLRVEIWRQRCKVHDMRIVSRKCQLVKDKADRRYIHYIQHVREVELGYDTHSSSEQLYQDCQNARDICGPIEFDLVEMEIELSWLEFSLDGLEQKFDTAQPPMSCQSTYVSTTPIPTTLRKDHERRHYPKWQPSVEKALIKYGPISNDQGEPSTATSTSSDTISRSECEPITSSDSRNDPEDPSTFDEAAQCNVLQTAPQSPSYFASFGLEEAALWGDG